MWGVPSSFPGPFLALWSHTVCWGGAWPHSEVTWILAFASGKYSSLIPIYTMKNLVIDNGCTDCLLKTKTADLVHTMVHKVISLL